MSAPKQTDLSRHLRALSNTLVVARDGYASDFAKAADEIERYYTGMLDWKAAAEAKDAQPVQQPASAMKCWSCGEEYDLAEHADADGNCPHCGVEIDQDDPVQQPAPVAAPVAGQEPVAQLIAMPGFMRRRVDQAVQEAVSPKGPSVHDGMARLHASDVIRMLAIIDAAAVPAASVQPVPGDLFDLIREWAYLPEGERGQAARNIIGCVNRHYSAGVADGRVLGAPAAAQPDSVRDAALVEVATWYKDKGWMLDEDDVPAAIRALGAAKKGGA